jgi:small subunit ribosomal protein S6
VRTYEALYIATPELEERDIQTIASDVEKLVADNGGAVVRSEIWGRRKLAYNVGKHGEGYYILLRFDAAPAFVKKLENYFRITETIIRFLIVSYDEQMLRLEAEQLRRNQESLQSGRRRDEERRGRRGDDDEDFDDEPRGRGRRRIAEDDEDDDEPMPVRGRRSEEDDED